ncbi:MAG: gliding motility-associated C-terminal domain-containing protein, partial [Phaeodactylibacter sp.]|nr:gliding motility-associated C-terminal domain-containing protein [Phaeodactylibacter sp.]
NLMSLDGGASSSGPNIVYAWTATSGGAIITDTSQLSVDIDGGGTYELVVTDLSNNCFSVASVIVQENTNTPNANAGPDMELDCLIEEVQLNGSASGNNVTYNWSTTDGGFTSSTTIQDPTVNAPGTYQMIATNQNNGCSDTSLVMVGQDINPPLADAGQDGEIDCAITSINLDASGSSGVGTLSYAWSTSDGNIVGSSTIPNPEVDAAGTYTVTITDSENGCTSTATVAVTDAGNAPSVDIATPGDITCTINAVMLDGSGSSGMGNLTYNWTVISGGSIQSGADTPFPTVGDAGIYQLEITDDANGCSSTMQVEVLEDQTSPTADPGMPFIISCLNPDVQLDGTNSTSGPNISYEWTTVSGGNIVSGSTTTTPTISAPGIYQLLVTNNTNGCASAALIEIEGDSETPEASVLAPGALNCQDTLLTINGSGSSIGANFDYQWSTPDGNITNGVNTLFATINAAGTYTLSVLNTNNGCIASEDVTIGIDTLAPLAEAGTSDFLTCVVTSLDLDGSNSSGGGTFSYLWSTQDGSISGDNTILTPTVTAPGTYVLTVFNSANFCVGLDSVVVDENTVLPDAAAVVDGELNCSVLDLTVDGSGSSSGTSILYNWMTVDGNIVSGDATNSPVVDMPGTYELTVLDTLNGCESTTAVTVGQDVQDPLADAGATATLTCAVEDLNLDGTGSSAGMQYNWTTQDGNIISGGSSTSPLIDQPGTYQLVVTDAGNTCTDTALVTIDQDIAAPTADAGLEETLTCLTPTLTLDGNGSSIGPNFTYNWTATNGGNILGTTTNLSPVIDAAGDYTIEVTNQDNGCTATETVSIDEDTTPPDADAGLTDELNCAVNTITLDGSGSSAGPDFSYTWSTPDGNIISGGSTLSPEIDEPGQYELLVLNSSNGCESTAMVSITENVQLPVADPGAAATLTCVLEDYTVGLGASTTGTDITYDWTTLDGNITGATNELETMVDAPGTYQLVVFNTTNFCSDTAAVTIDQDIVSPAVEAGPAFILDCLEDMVNLDGTGTSTGANFSYTWTTDDGNLLNGQDGLSPAINTAGTYELLVTNILNGCESTDEVIVTEDADAPSADAGTAIDLTCLVTELDLSGTASSVNGSFSVAWTPVSGGNIVSGAATLAPTIDAPGTYQLTVVDLINNCQAFSTVVVNEDVTQPDAVATIDDELNCYNASVTVEGAGSSSGANFTYQWTTTDGMILGSPTVLNPEVGTAGTYQLEVTDQNNGCVQTAMVQVTQDTLHPVVSIASPDLLTCLETAIDLSASTGNTGPNFSIDWTTSNGTIDSGAGSLAPVVSDPGTYMLTIQDLDNGCTGTASVVVDEDVDLPTAEAGATNELDCAQTSLSLDGTGSDQGSNFAYSWTASNGGVMTGPTNILTPTVLAAGSYEIEVTNTANGCVSTDLVMITIDTIAPFVSVANPDQLTCIVDELNLSATGSSSGPNYDYTWAASGGGNIVDVSNPMSPLVNQVGSYTLTILDAGNSCTSSFTVSVSANMVEPGADAGVTTQLDCTESSISLQGSAVSGTNVSYAWTTADGNIVSGANTATPDVDAAGTYTLLVVDLNNGCESTDMVEITTNVPTDFGFVAQRPVCNSNTGIIEFTGITGGEPPYVYTINGGDDYFNTNFYAALPPGTYEVGIQDANGCELWDVAVVDEGIVIDLEVETAVIIDLGDSYQIQTDLNLDPSEIQSITWTPTDGLSCTDCLNPIVTPTDNIEYEVRVETLEGCEATDRITLFVRKDLNVYIPTAFSPNGDNNNDVFMIFANDQIARVNSFLVFNRWGETV